MSGPESTPDEDSRWAEIIANYGDRAELSAKDLKSEELDSGGLSGTADGYGSDRHDGAPDDVSNRRSPLNRMEWVSEPNEPEPPMWWEQEPEGYRPPPPPPLGRTTPIRLIAWLLLIGGPIVLVALAVFRIAVPMFLSMGLLAGVLASFGYLLWTASPEPREPWDDGAEV